MRPEITRAPGDLESNTPRHLLASLRQYAVYGRSGGEASAIARETEKMRIGGKDVESEQLDWKRLHGDIEADDDLCDSMPIDIEPDVSREGVYIGKGQNEKAV